MLLTEEQAREKWCPHVREAEYQDAGNSIATFNRGPSEQPVRSWNTCLASDCAMWRFARKEIYSASTDGTYAPIRTESDEFETVGYCGLAGKP